MESQQSGVLESFDNLQTPVGHIRHQRFEGLHLTCGVHAFGVHSQLGTVRRMFH